MMRRFLIAEDSLAAMRTRNKLGIAIAAMIRMKGIEAMPMYPRMVPAKARP